MGIIILLGIILAAVEVLCPVLATALRKVVADHKNKNI